MVLKLFASRPSDLADAESVALRNRAQLEWDHIEKELTPLAETKGDPAIFTAFARLRQLKAV
jgi:hypothetical protein